jgi:hypothetical protein
MYRRLFSHLSCQTIFPLYTIATLKKFIKKTERVPYRDIPQANIDCFTETLQALNWSEVTGCEDGQAAYNRFSDIFMNFFELHYFPLVHQWSNYITS